MNSLYSQWKKDERAPFKGWNFTYIKRRKKSEKPPWNYEKEAKKLIKKSKTILDIGTGGGEILFSLKPLPKKTYATESWLPSVPVARKKLKLLGVKVFKTDKSGKLPFKNNKFDLVLDRHSYYNDKEVFRVLKCGGIFLTQQVGGDNLRDLTEEFNSERIYGDWSSKVAVKKLKKVGFKIESTKEWRGKIEFKDIGAMVYTLKAIPWIVKGFNVDKYLSILEKFQKRIDRGKKLSFINTRFLIKARKV